MSQSNSKILHFHVVTVVETSSSVAMEKYGLVKALDKLKYWGLDITCSVAVHVMVTSLQMIISQ